MIVGQSKTEVPDECGDFCTVFISRGSEQYPIVGQGDLCTRCPIFCCKHDPVVGALVEPEEYSEVLLKGFLKMWGRDETKR